METSNLVNDSQFGFRVNRSCSDGLRVLNTAIEANKLSNKETNLLFVDLKAAYDYVSWSKLISILTTMKFPKQFINFLTNYYQGDNIVSRAAGLLTNPQFQQRGLRQGCNMSSILFIIYMVGLSLD